MSRLFLCAKKRKGNGQGSGMIGASFEEGEVLFMKICAHCGNAMMDEAKFCVNCGTQANGYSNYTYQSQQNRNFFDNSQMLRQNIGIRETVSGIIWICVGGIQTLISIFAFWYLIFVGIWNIVFGIKRVNKKDKLLYMSIDEIYNDYSSRLASIIVFLVLNVLFGGIIGVAGAIYDLVVRNYVIQNIQQQKTYIGNSMPSNNQVSYQPMNQSHEYINKHLDETNNTFIAQEEKNPDNIDKKATDAIQPLLTRANMFLEDANWEKVDQYAERILDSYPECAEAYLLKLMAQLRAQNIYDLIKRDNGFENNINFQRFLQYADETNAEQVKLLKYEPIYIRAVELLKYAKGEGACNEAKKMFRTIPEYKDANEQIKECEIKKEKLKEEKYYDLVKKFNGARTSDDFTNILFKFYELQDYKETSDYISECEKNIAYINAINEIRHSSNVVALEKTKKLFLGFAGFKESNKYIEKIDEKILMLKKRKKRIKTIIIIALIAVFVLIAVKLTSSFLYYRSDDYKLLKAKEFMANEQYSQAMEYLNDMEDKKVANQQIKKIQCKEAKSYFEKEEYDKAIAIYHKWGEKEEERKVIQQKALMLLYENKFTEAIKLYEQIKDEDNLIFAYGRLARYYRDSGEYDKAIEIYNKIDSEEGKESVYEFQAYNLIDQKRYDEVEKLYKYIKDENILKDIQEEVCRQKTEN